MSDPRQTPFSKEAEEGILSCLLQADTKQIMEWSGDKRSLRTQDFFFEPNAVLFEACMDMVSKGIPPADPALLCQHLSDRKQLDFVGGAAFISHLMDASPSAAMYPYYRDIVREKAIRRETIDKCGRIIAQCHNAELETAALLDEAETAILSVRSSNNNVSEKSIKDHILAFIEALQKRVQGERRGLPTGFGDMDRILQGLRPSEMIVIAARPSQGKTAMGLNIACHIAETVGPVGFFSLEMDAPSIVERCVSAYAGLSTFRPELWDEQAQRAAVVATNRVRKLPLLIDDDQGLTVSAIRSRARRWKMRHNINLLVIDYLQLIASDGREDRRVEVDKISRGIKALAKELGIPILVLAQLNRELEKEKSRRPRLSDLRESGSIEQDADVINFLYRTDDNDPNNMSPEVSFLVAKQRNGPTGECKFTFQKYCTRFEPISKIPQNI